MNQPQVEIKKTTTISYPTTVHLPAKELVRVLSQAIEDGGYKDPVITVRTYDSQRDGAETTFEVREAGR